ncbi:Translation factor pelota [Savitreella phatthalungensis]
MKLIRRHLEKDKSGFMTLCPEQPEDMWHTYNLLQVGDVLKATTVRRVVHESATGTTSSQKVRTNLSIVVTKVDFDAQASALHANGTVCEENAYAKLNAHHTLDLELNRNFTINKPEWDAYALERVNLACDPARTAEVGAVVLQEGLAHICLLTEHMTVTRLRIEQSIPRKVRGSSSQHDKSLERFYDTVYEGVRKHLFDDVPGSDDNGTDTTGLKAILIASPGFVGEGLVKRMMTRATNDGRKDILRARPKILLVHCSSGHLFSLHEVLKSQEVVSQLADTKYAREAQLIEKFYRQMNDDETRAWYGPQHVAAAVEHGAVGTLLLTDTLFRADNVATRKKYVAMCDAVKQAGGSVAIFSSLHETGQQLAQLGEIAAILTIPLAEDDLGLGDLDLGAA